MRLVLDATNREQARLIAEVLSHFAIVMEHVPEVGVVSIVLGSTPPTAVVTNVVETAIRYTAFREDWKIPLTSPKLFSIF